MGPADMKEKNLDASQKLVRISKNEALEMQLKLITDWEPQKDVWPFRFGGAILSAASVVSSVYLMGYYRRKFKLLSYGRPLMFIPGVIVPAMMIPVFYQKAVTDELLLQTACPVCIQLRGALIQSSLAVGYPLLVHSLGAFAMANTYATYRLPAVSLSTLGQIWTLWRKMTLPIHGILAWHIASQIALAFFITEYQAKSFFDVQEKILLKIKSSSS